MRPSAILVTLALFSNAFALRGLVLDTAARPLVGVEVRASWDAMSDTTDSVGTWSLAEGTGVVRKDGASWRWTRGAVHVRLDRSGPLRLEAVDVGGRILWRSSVAGRAGWNRIALPRSVGKVVSVLRIHSPEGEMILARRGEMAPTASASRATGALRVLSFRRSGYIEVLREIADNQDTVLTVLRRAPDTTGKVARVQVSPDTGVHASLPQVSFASATPGATFFYTLDSSAPSWDTATLLPRTSTTFAWKSADGPIGLQRSVWLRVAAGRHGMSPSDTLTGRYVYIGDSALVEDFEGTGLGAFSGVQGLSWFACVGCEQDQKNQLERTLLRSDTAAPDYGKQLGKRSWRMQVNIAQKGEDDHPGYAGCALRIPPGYSDSAYRLVFWAKWQDTWSGKAVPKMPMVVELALKGNAKNNGGYQDGMHRVVIEIGGKWKQYEIDFSQFHGAGNAYAPADSQPDSTASNPRNPSVFFLDPTMPALGLSGYQGNVTHNDFLPAWTWGVSKDSGFAKSDLVGVRFSVIQPMDSATAASVGAQTDPAWTSRFGDHSQWKDPREPPYTSAQLGALVKDIHGFFWIDNVLLVRKSL